MIPERLLAVALLLFIGQSMPSALGRRSEKCFLARRLGRSVTVPSGSPANRHFDTRRSSFSESCSAS